MDDSKQDQQLPEQNSATFLDPVDRITEVIFGILMTLTVTGSINVGHSGSAEVHGMLISAIGCNIAWGIVDAVMFLLSSLIDRSHGVLMFHKLHATTDEKEAEQIVEDALPSGVAYVMRPAELRYLVDRLRSLPEPPMRQRVQRGQWLGAVAIFFLVFASTFPVVIPFIFFEDITSAMRISNLVAVTILFICGLLLGRYSGANPVRMGIRIALIGIALAAIVIALGG